MYKCEILKDSINPVGTRLTTMRLRFPRFILAEFNTHRQFSRNAGSSRAISTARRIQMIQKDPVTPIEWGLKAKTMHATDVLGVDQQKMAETTWHDARRSAIVYATQLDALGVHKQIVNRILEPFCWVDVIVSSTEWNNFFSLRISEKAQPEIRHIALMMREELEKSTPIYREWGTWHSPLHEDHQVAVGRLARVSYEANPKTEDEDRELTTLLAKDGHWSPFEHVAQAKAGDAKAGTRNFGAGWVQWRAMID